MRTESAAATTPPISSTVRGYLSEQRGQRIIPAWFIVVAGVQYLLTTSISPMVNADSAAYLGLARSLAAGEGYVFNGVPHVTYPPGFPLLLSPLVAVFGIDPVMIQRYIALWFVLGAVLFLVYLRERRDGLTLVALPLFLVSGAVYQQATTAILSEMPYLAISIGYLVVAELVARSGRPGAWQTLGGAFLVAMAMATRSIGIALPAAIMATALHQLVRSWREGRPRPRQGFAVAGIVAGAIFFAGWSTWVSQVQGSRPTADVHNSVQYTELIRLKDPHQPDLGPAAPSDLVRRLATRVQGEAAHQVELLTNIPWLKPMWSSPLVLLIISLVVVGWRREFHRPGPIAAWYAAAYLVVLLLWPFDEGVRFSLPLLPLLVIFLINGVRATMRWISARDLATIGRIGTALALLGLVGAVVEGKLGHSLSRQNLAAIGGWGILLLAAGSIWTLSSRLTAARLVQRIQLPVVALYLAGYITLGVFTIGHEALANVEGRPRSPHHALPEAASWIVQHTDSRAVIMAEQAGGLHLMTGRQTVYLPVTGDHDRLLDAMQRERPHFLLIVDPPEYPYYFPTEVERLELIEAVAPGVLSLVYDYDGGRIFSVSLPR